MLRRLKSRLKLPKAFSGRAPRNGQRGFAYLLALFMVVSLIIASQVAMKNLVTEGRREREADMIWRGQQYVRAIRLYYRKTGHYPQTLDDLKKGMPELHFLRYAAYKDPMKKEDGAWRFIYVNATGQIIGSVKYATLQQMAIMDMNGGKIPSPQNGNQPNQLGIPASLLADRSGANAANSSANSPGQPPANPPGASASSGNAAPGATPGSPPASPLGSTPDNSASAGIGSQSASNNPPTPTTPTGFGAQPNPSPFGSSFGSSPSPTNGIGTPVTPGGLNTNQNNLSLAALAALKPTGPVDGPVLGGFLTGVGSTVDKPSIRIYNGGKKYLDWEFIWNPVEDQAKAVQQGITNPQGALPGQPGQSIGGGPAGTSIFGNPPGAQNSPSGFGPGSLGPASTMDPNQTAPQNASPFGPAPRQQ